MGVFLDKKECLAKSDEKSLFSKLQKINSLFTKLEEKWGYMGGKSLLVPLPERMKKVLFLVRSERKKFAQGKNPLHPPPHVSPGLPLSGTDVIRLRTKTPKIECTGKMQK